MRKVLAVLCPCLVLALPLLAGRLCFAHYEGFPHNDDFLYARCTQILVEEGRYQHITQYGSLTASVASHCIWGALFCLPLGFSYPTLHLSVAAAAWIAAVCLLFLARFYGLSRAMALLLSGTLVVSPYVYGLSFTFMTDVTAMMFVMIAVMGYIIGLQKRSLAWLFLGAVGTTLALWARQTHLVAVVVAFIPLVGMFLFDRDWKRLSPAMLVAVGIPVIAYIVFQLGWLLPGDDDRLFRIRVKQYDAAYFRERILYIYRACLLTGVVLLPMLPLLIASIRSAAGELTPRARRIALIAGLTTAAPLFAVFVGTGGRAYITQSTGYIVHNGHYGPILLADQAERWSDMGGVQWHPLLWQVLTIASIACIGVLAWWSIYTVSRWRTCKDDPLLQVSYWSAVAMLVASVSAVAGLMIVVEALFDRYWMLLYPFLFTWIASLLARWEQSLSRWLYGVSLSLVLAMFAVSFVYTHDFLAWNKTRADQVDRWLAQGLQPQEFDAGNGINGWFRTFEDFDTFARPGDQTIYWRGLADVALSIGPREGWTIEDRLPWKSWAVNRECYILVIRREHADAKPGP